MKTMLISLDEVDRLKRAHGVTTIRELADIMPISRRTLSVALRDRRATSTVLNAFAAIGADPERILIIDEGDALITTDQEV